jgi:hypothetical protein
MATEEPDPAKIEGSVAWTAEGLAIHRERNPAILRGLISEYEVAKAFGVKLRTVREKARAKNLGRRPGPVRWFTEAEICILMERKKNHAQVMEARRLAELVRARSLPRAASGRKP